MSGKRSFHITFIVLTGWIVTPVTAFPNFRGGESREPLDLLTIAENLFKIINNYSSFYLFIIGLYRCFFLYSVTQRVFIYIIFFIIYIPIGIGVV